MPLYVLVVFDSEDQVVDVRAFEAGTDAAALHEGQSLCRRMALASTCEVWKGGKKLARQRLRAN